MKLKLWTINWQILAFVLMSLARCLFQTSTQQESTCFPRYNEFIDSSIDGTFRQQMSINVEADFINSTSTSPLDDELFKDLERYDLHFDGNSGLRAEYRDLVSTQVPVPNSWKLNFAHSEWTLMMWFKLDQLPKADDQVMTLFSFEINQAVQPQVLDCKLYSMVLRCFEQVADLTMELNLKDIGFKANDWYLIVIQSADTVRRLSVRDQGWSKQIDFSKTSDRPCSLGNLNVNLGLERNAKPGTGFKGYLKGFKLFNRLWADQSDWKRISFQYLIPEGNPSLQLELMLDNNRNTSGRYEQVNKAVFDYIKAAGVLEPKISADRDLSPCWDCFYQDPNDYKSFFRFQGPKTVLDDIKLTNYKDTGKDGSYQTTLKMWVYREHLTSTQGEVSVNENGKIIGRQVGQTGTDEILFQHADLVTLAFFANSTDFLTIYNFNDPSIKIQVKVPRGQWVWLQVEHCEEYFGAFIEDMDRRIISKATELTKHRSAPNYKTAAGPVKIASNFYGYIMGLQYFRNLQINKDAQYFQDLTSTNSSLLLYFKFDRDNVDEKGQFKALATYLGGDYSPAKFGQTLIEVSPLNPNQTIIRVNDKQLLFDRLPWKARSAIFNTGDVSNTVNWSGIQCATDKLSVKLKNQNAMMKLNFNTQNMEMRSPYLSLWLFVQNEYRNLPDGPIVKIVSLDDPLKTYMSLGFQANQLVCNLFDTIAGKKVVQQVKYTQYSTWMNQGKWMHVSCFIDGNNPTTNLLQVGKNHLLGQIYSLGESFSYSFKESDGTSKYQRPQQDYIIPDSRLQLQFNGPSFLGWNLGFGQNDGVYFQDVRIWNRRLSDKEIMVNRRQKIVNPSDEKNLLVYAPLVEGVRYPFKFFNFLTHKTFRHQNVQYMVAPNFSTLSQSLLICPYYMLYSEEQKACILDVFARPQTFNVLVMKDKVAKEFNLTFDLVQYIKSQNEYFRLASPMLVKPVWQLLNLNELQNNLQVKDAIAAQVNAQQLSLTNSVLKQIKSSDKIRMGLTIAPYLNPATIDPISTTFQLNLDPCSSFYDMDTGKSYVVKHLLEEKGTTPVTFSFSGTGCPGYNFDVNKIENFEVQLFYGEQRPLQLLGTQMVSKKQNQFSINQNLLMGVSFNQPFYIICSANFKGPDSSQFLSIIYKLDYQSSIVLNLPPQDLGITEGKDMYVDASQVSIINADDRDSLQKALEWVWLCPDQLDCSRITTNQPRFILLWDQAVKIPNFDFMTKYQFLLRIRTNRNIPPEVPYLQRQINVTWIGAPKSVHITYDSRRFPVSKDIEVGVNITDQGWVSEVNIEWTVVGTDVQTGTNARNLVPERDFMNSNNRVKFIINKGSLTVLGVYDIYLKLYAKRWNQPLIYYTSVKIQVVTNPYSGGLDVSSDTYFAFTGNFKLTATNWLSYLNVPQGLVYQFFFANSDNKWISLTKEQTDTVLNTFLPDTKKIAVRVTDDLGGTTFFEQDVSIKLPTGMGYESYQNQVQATIDKIYQQDQPQQQLPKLVALTQSLKPLSQTIESNQVKDLSSLVLQGLAISLKKLKGLNETKEKVFVTETAFNMLVQTQQLDQNRKSLGIIQNSLYIMNLLVSNSNDTLNLLLQNSDSKTATDFLSLVSSIYGDLNGFSFTLDQQSEDNRTLSAQSMQFRNMLTPMEQIIGNNIAEGQAVTINNDQMEVYMQKYSIQSGQDFNIISQDKNVKVLFPLSQIEDKTEAQTITFIAFSNYADTKGPLGPNFDTVGGPFSGKEFSSQKILSNSTVYMTLRNANGNEIISNQRANITFSINKTDYFESIFRQGRENRVKCAYIPTTDYNFDSFKTDKCSTRIINDYNKVIFDSDNTYAVQESVGAFNLAKDSKILTVECSCAHRSYYTIVEDFEIVDSSKINNEEKGTNVDKLTTVNDWATVVVILLFVIGLIGSLMYSKNLDDKDWGSLQQIEEMDEKEQKHPTQQNELSVISLMSLVFKRRLDMEPYAVSNNKSLFQNKKYVDISTWPLFTLYMWNIHPWFSIAGHHDIALLRFDRVMVMLLKTSFSWIVCYFLISPIQQEWASLNFNQISILTTENNAVGEEFTTISNEMRIFASIILTFLIMMPLPSVCFCCLRANHKLQVEVMSEGMESEAFQRYLKEANVIVNSEQVITEQLELKGSQQKLKVVKEVEIFVDSLWPMEVMITMNQMPLQSLRAIHSVLKMPYTSSQFQKVIEAVEKQSQVMKQEVMGEVNDEDVISVANTEQSARNPVRDSFCHKDFDSRHVSNRSNLKDIVNDKSRNQQFQIQTNNQEEYMYDLASKINYNSRDSIAYKNNRHVQQTVSTPVKSNGSMRGHYKGQSVDIHESDLISDKPNEDIIVRKAIKYDHEGGAHDDQYFNNHDQTNSDPIRFSFQQKSLGIGFSNKDAKVFSPKYHDQFLNGRMDTKDQQSQQDVPSGSVDFYQIEEYDQEVPDDEKIDVLNLREVPYDGNNPNYIRDENGIIYALEEINPDIDQNELYMKYEGESSEEEPELVYIDEKKELVYISNSYSKNISRLVMFGFMVMFAYFWANDYFVIKKLWRQNSWLWQGVYVGTYILCQLVIIPLFLWLHAFLMCMGGYRFLFCKSREAIRILFPLSYMLYLDLLIESEMLKYIKEKQSIEEMKQIKTAATASKPKKTEKQQKQLE